MELEYRSSSAPPNFLAGWLWNVSPTKRHGIPVQFVGAICGKSAATNLQVHVFAGC